MSRARNLALEIKLGGRPETRGIWAPEQVVYAYAAWLSPEFHTAVIEAFTHAVRGDGEAAIRSEKSRYYFLSLLL